MNKSCTSGLRLVNPQAMRWLCPTLMKGSPGREKPSTLKSPEWSCTSYHTPGTRCGKCISFDSSGLPETVCAPESTQLFEPGRQASHESSLFMCGRERGGECGESWLAFLRMFAGGFCIGAELLVVPASLAGGWSCHESGGYKSAISSGENLAPIFSRQYSVSYCGFSSWLMPMPIRRQSVTVQGRGW